MKMQQLLESDFDTTLGRLAMQVKAIQDEAKSTMADVKLAEENPIDSGDFWTTITDSIKRFEDLIAEMKRAMRDMDRNGRDRPGLR
jgi:hypothetical protein